MKRRSLIGIGLAAATAGLPREASAQPARAASAPTPGPASGQGRDPCAPATTAPRPPRGRPRIGLALGSGSVHGLAHLGVLRVLEREGLRPDLVAGTSAGAIIAALYAAGLGIAKIEAIARAIDWEHSGSLIWPSRGLMSSEPLQLRLEKALGKRLIEALPMGLGVVTTSLLEGEKVLFRNGPTARIVAASSSIPVLFEPVRIGGRDYVDGSLTEPVPVDSARAMGADFVIAVDVAYRPQDEKPGGITGIAFQMMHIMVNALLAEQIGRADFALRLDLHRLMRGAWDPQTLIDEGERVASQAWPELARRLHALGYAPGTGSR